jgi:hypothetical protein
MTLQAGVQVLMVNQDNGCWSLNCTAFGGGATSTAKTARQWQ